MSAKLRGVSGLLIVGLLVASCAERQPSASPRSETETSDQVSGTESTDQAVGSALARTLGLERVGAPPAGCTDYVEVEESGAGYCLNSVSGGQLEKWDIAMRLQGRVPSELERRIRVLELQISAIPLSPETEQRLADLTAELDRLLNIHDGSQKEQ